MKACLRPTYLEVDLDRLKYNMENIRSLLGKDDLLMGVVKADAYGLGAVATAQLGENIFDYLGVATLIEALELRKHHIQTPILILGYLEEEYIDLLIENNISQTVYSLDQAEKISRQAQAQNRQAKLHIKIDTGMSRLGLQTKDHSLDIIESIMKLKNIRVEGIFSHFIDAENKDKSLCRSQYGKFMDFLGQLEARNIKFPIRHISNSGAIIDLEDYNLDMVRAGIIIYGLYPENVARDRLDLRFTAALRSKLADIKYIESGDYVGYSKAYRADKKMKIATIPIGYADGYTEEIRARINPKIAGVEVKVIGNICMDQTILDISHIEDARPGDLVSLFDYQDQDKLEIRWLAAIARRVPRVYMRNKKLEYVKDYLLD